MKMNLFFQNDVSEQEQRWGAKTIEGSGHQESLKLVDVNLNCFNVLVFFHKAV